MTERRLEVQAELRTIPPGYAADTSLYTLAWQATQRWITEIERLNQAYQAALENENKTWILLADECFRFQKIHRELVPVLEQHELVQSAKEVTLTMRRLQNMLLTHGVTIEDPTGLTYSLEMQEIVESVDQLFLPDIREPVIQEVLVPIIKRKEQVIRFGKAVIAIPEQS